MHRMQRYTIQLAPTQAAALTAMATRHEHSVAAEIRAAVALHLDAAAADLNANGPRRREAERAESGSTEDQTTNPIQAA